MSNIKKITKSHPPDPNAKPKVNPTTKDVNIDIIKENESAITLAKTGYDIKQNPGNLPNGKKPDYFIEGHYFDC